MPSVTGRHFLPDIIIRRSGCYPVFERTAVTYFPIGEEKWYEMLRQLEQAKHFIFLEYFIVDEGLMWGKILEILARKAAEGVDVRVMYDGTCEFSTLPHDYPKRLKALGIKCKMFAPVSIGEDISYCRQALETRRRALDAEVAAACRIVDMLPDSQCGILYRYFVGGQSQGAITEALHYTTRYYKRKKKEGLAIAEGMDETMVDALLPDWYLAAEKKRH